MKRLLISSLVVSAVAVAACRDTAAPASKLAISMASTFSVAPAGFEQTTSTFIGTEGLGAFEPSFGGRGHGPGGFGTFGFGPGFGIGFMCGGLDGAFVGNPLHPFNTGKNCVYSSSTGIVTCADTTRDGLIVNRTLKLTSASGQSQSTIDSTTNTIVTTVAVNGITTRRDSSTSAISETSTQMLGGFAKGSPQHTVDGSSAGTETTTGTSPEGVFTAKRMAGDTVKGVLIPVSTTNPFQTYPTAGTIIRAMSATVTISGQSPATSTRREVITYDGSSTAKVVITQNDSTQNCTLPLPRGRLTCS